MSVKVVTVDEAERMVELAKQYGESCVPLFGAAKQDFICDITGVPIDKGQECAAVAIHPSPKHFNYQSDVDRLSNYVDV